MSREKKTQDRKNIKTYNAGDTVKIWDSSDKVWIFATVTDSNAMITNATYFNRVIGREMVGSFKTVGTLPA